MLNALDGLALRPSVGGPGAAGSLQSSTAGAISKTQPLPTDFGEVLGQMTMDAIGVVKGGEATAVAGVRGQASTQQVVEAVMAAEQTLQTGIAIRDKVVSAYLEISRMSI